MKRICAVLVSIVLLFGGIAVPLDAGQSVAHAADLSAYPYQTSVVNGDRVSFKNGTSFNVVKGKTKKLKLNTSGNIKWKTSNPKVATVSSKGVVKGKNTGKVTIVAVRTTTGSYAKCTVGVYPKRTQQQAYKLIVALKNNQEFAEGTRWTNDDYYYWEAGNMHARGCAAFAAMMSDYAFSKYAPVKKHATFSKIKVGDTVRYRMNTSNPHSVCVLQKKANSIVVAEGNFNSSCHWFREIPSSEITSSGFQVTTRY